MHKCDIPTRTYLAKKVDRKPLIGFFIRLRVRFIAARPTGQRPEKHGNLALSMLARKLGTAHQHRGFLARKSPRESAHKTGDGQEERF